MDSSSNKVDPVEVLIVDDSALMRNLVSRIVESDPALTVVATAMNGRFALQKIETHHPDIIVLDLEMPEMNGIAFLQERRSRGIEIPVVILSSVAIKGAAITMEALNLGAVDFIMKPSGSVSEDIHLVGTQLIELLRHYGRDYRRRSPGKPAPLLPPPAPRRETPVESRHEPEPDDGKDIPRNYQFKPVRVDPVRLPPEKVTPSGAPGPLEIIAIGISTGGPNALRKVFAELDPAIKVPILVVQHMPPGFTTEFAKSLDRICPLEVKEAAEGDLVKPGRILIAPGDYHIRVEKRSLASIIHLDQGGAVNGHRPSADVLFESVGSTYGNRAMGVIMTGMGRDGADKLGLIYRAGGVTLGQDEASSVVYGMPRVAWECGHVLKQVSLDDMAKTINEQVRLLAPS